jgi:hypothetical protein
MRQPQTLVVPISLAFQIVIAIRTPEKHARFIKLDAHKRIFWNAREA